MSAESWSRLRVVVGGDVVACRDLLLQDSRDQDQCVAVSCTESQ